MDELAGKAAVVTGAGGGIGRAMALSLASAGMDVAVLDIDGGAASRVAAEIGGRSFGLACDVSQREAVRAAADRIFDEFGAVHVLCNNAGVTCFKPLDEMTDADWDWIIGVDLMGIIHGYQAFVPRMIAQGTGGHVVNTSSGVGVVPDMLPDHTAYAAAKAAGVALAASLRTELAPKGIGVSVVCPGMVRTDILRSGRVRPDRFGGPDGAEEVVPGMPDPLDAAMDPAIVGDMVVDAIRADRQFVFPHTALRDQVRGYYERMLADF